MKILVTGRTGRIGANLVKQLLAKGHEIRSFVYPVTHRKQRFLNVFFNSPCPPTSKFSPLGFPSLIWKPLR